MSVVDSREDVLFKLKYATCFGTRMARLLTRLQWAARIVTLFAATIAMSNLTSALEPRAVVALGVILSLLTIIEIVIDPGRLAEVCRSHIAEIAVVSAKAESLTDEELRSEWARLASKNAPAPELKALRLPVFNEVAVQVGRRDATQQLSVFQRLVYFAS